MSTRIDVLCHDGSPIGIIHEDIYGEAGRIGVGGAELALLTLCEYLASDGNDVRLYNTPRVESKNPYFSQLPVAVFDPQEDRDVLIIFRSPHPKSLGAKGMKVWWSCDPNTVGNYKQFASTVHKIVVISEFHKNKFRDLYDIRNSEVIDLPVRISDYEREQLPREHRVLFSSVPDRGLVYMKQIWPVVLAQVPDAELTITSDYRLWGASSLNEQYRLMFSQIPNVHFRGAITRDKLISDQISSRVLAYPCIFEELFCIACAEAQVAGCLPITTPMGALATTNMYKLFVGDIANPYDAAKFAGMIVDELKTPNEAARLDIQKKALARFNPERIVSEWKERIFK